MQGKRRESQPEFQPITQLSLIAHHIDGMVESASEQYANLLQARPKPYVLDDYTVGRVREVFTTQHNDLWLFDEQLKRWKAGQLSTAQREEVERLVRQMAKLRQVIDSILNLADELQEGDHREATRQERRATGPGVPATPIAQAVTRRAASPERCEPIPAVTLACETD